VGLDTCPVLTPRLDRAVDAELNRRITISVGDTMKRLLASLIAGMLLSAAVWAQGPAPAAPAPAQTTFVSTRSPLVDGAIFAVLAGGAVFAVARTSSRV